MSWYSIDLIYNGWLNFSDDNYFFVGYYSFDTWHLIWKWFLFNDIFLSFDTWFGLGILFWTLICGDFGIGWLFFWLWLSLFINSLCILELFLVIRIPCLGLILWFHCMCVDRTSCPLDSGNGSLIRLQWGQEVETSYYLSPP